MATKLQPIIDRLALSFDEMYTYATRLGLELENIDARLDKVEKGESFVSLPQQGSFGASGALKVKLETGAADDFFGRFFSNVSALFAASAVSKIAPYAGFGGLVLAGLGDELANLGGRFAGATAVSLINKAPEIFEGLGEGIQRSLDTLGGPAGLLGRGFNPFWELIRQGQNKASWDSMTKEQQDAAIQKTREIIENQEQRKQEFQQLPKEEQRQRVKELEKKAFGPQSSVSPWLNPTIKGDTDYQQTPIGIIDNNKIPATFNIYEGIEGRKNREVDIKGMIGQMVAEEMVWSGTEYGAIEILKSYGKAVPFLGWGITALETMHLMSAAYEQKQSGEGLLHDLSTLSNTYSQDLLASTAGSLAETAITLSPFFSAPWRAGKAYLSLIRANPEVASPWLQGIEDIEDRDTLGGALKDVLGDIGNVFVPPAGAMGKASARAMKLWVEMMMKKMEEETPLATNFMTEEARLKTMYDLEDAYLAAPRKEQMSLDVWAIKEAERREKVAVRKAEKRGKSKQDFVEELAEVINKKFPDQKVDLDNPDDRRFLNAQYGVPPDVRQQNWYNYMAKRDQLKKNRKLFDEFKKLPEVPDEFLPENLRKRQGQVAPRNTGGLSTGSPASQAKPTLPEIERIVKNDPRLQNRLDEIKRTAQKIADEIGEYDSRDSGDYSRGTGAFEADIDEENLVTILARMLDPFRGLSYEAREYLNDNDVIWREMVEFAEEQLRLGDNNGDWTIFNSDFWSEPAVTTPGFDADDFISNQFDPAQHFEDIQNWPDDVLQELVKKRMSQVDPSWTHIQQTAFDAYVGAEATKFNRVLRGEEPFSSLSMQEQILFVEWLKLFARYSINPHDAGKRTQFRGIHSGGSHKWLNPWYRNLPEIGDIVLETNFLSTSYDPQSSVPFANFSNPFGTFLEIQPDDASQWLGGSYREHEAIYGAGSMFEVEDSFTRLIPMELHWGRNSSNIDATQVESLVPFSFARLRHRLDRSLFPNWIAGGDPVRIYKNLRDLPPEVKKYLERIYGSKSLKTVGGLGIGYGAYSVFGGGSVAYAQEPQIVSMDENGVAVFSDGTVKDYSKFDTNLRLPRAPSLEEQVSQFLRTPVEEGASDVEEAVAGMVEGQQKFIDPNKPWQYVDTVTGGQMGQYLEDEDEEGEGDEANPVKDMLSGLMELFELGDRDKIDKGASAISDLSPGFLGETYYEFSRYGNLLDDIEATFPRDKPDDREFFDQSRQFLDRAEEEFGEAISNLPWGKRIKEEAALAEKAIQGLEASSDRFGRQVSEAFVGTVLQTENWKERLKLIPGQLQDLILQTTVINPVRSLLQQFISSAAGRIVGGFFSGAPAPELIPPEGVNPSEYVQTITGGQFEVTGEVEFNQIVNGADPARARKYGEDIRDSLLGR